MIRAAVPQDAKQVAPLMIQAMEELACQFAVSDDPRDALPAFEHFFTRQNNQYSYENTLVFESEAGVVGSIVGYDGGRLEDYRRPFMQYLRDHYGYSNEGLEPETQAGEFYIDTVSVHAGSRGKGVGKALIRSMCAKAQALGHHHAALLVAPYNIEARKLYTHMGFKPAGEKQFAGGIYEHMIFVLV